MFSFPDTNMKLFIFLTLVALVASAPTSDDSETTTPAADDDIIKIDDEFFSVEFKIHTAENEIVKLYYPINALNLGDDDDENETTDRYIFFIEADEDGKYKGISVLINNQTYPLLPTGTSVASSIENQKIAYFGASDGLYLYNGTKNAAEKYGTVTDNIIDIAKANGTEDIYIVTDKNEVYKVTENGTKKDLIPEAAGAKKIVLDDTNNLYFYGEDKKLSILTAEGVKKVEDLPEATNITLLNPAFVMEQSIPVIVNNKAYFVASNGSVETASAEFEVAPSAVSVEATLMLYMAKGNSIYEYNVLAIIMSESMSQLKDFLNDRTDEIQSLSTRSRSDI